MKSLRITLGVAAIAIGSFAAFSFAPAEANNLQETGNFYVNPDDGSMGDPVVGTNKCLNPGPICSQEYNIETEEPTGNNIVHGVRQP
jgi:hypothetical protein